MKKLKLYILSIVATISLKSILDYMYYKYVSVYFLADLFFLDFSLEKQMISYLMLLIITLFAQSIISNIKKPSRIIILIYFISLVIPILTLYSFQNASTLFVLAVVLNFIFICFSVNYLPKFKVRYLHKSLVKILITVIFMIYIYVYSYLILTGGLSRLNFNLVEIYDVRAEFVKSTANGPLLGYFIPWTANIFNMSLLVWGLFKKKKSFVFIAVLFQFLLFGMTNFRSFLFAPILVLFVYVFTKKYQLLFLSAFSAIVILIISYSSFLLSGNHQWASMIIRRLFFVPANLHLIYYEFFHQKNNPFIYWSNSILEFFVDYTYAVSISRVISWEYWGRDFGANVGFLGEAYAQLGYFGMFLSSFFLIILLKIIDSCADVLPPNIVASVIALPAFSLVNSALFTTMLTHGFIISIIVLLIMTKLKEAEVQS
jgi:hypothetical protein